MVPSLRAGSNDFKYLAKSNPVFLAQALWRRLSSICCISARTIPKNFHSGTYRWVGSDHSTDAGYLVPYAKLLLRHLALQTLVWVLDGRVVGRGGVALMIHRVYKGRALPLAWPVRQGAKGHLPEDLHSALVEQVQQLTPAGCVGRSVG